MEIFGIFVVTCALFAIAALISCCYLALALLALRKYPYRRKRLVLCAGLLPLGCAAYVLVASISLSVVGADLLFGDIDVPLPNGYRLTAMGKMHHNANIAGPFPESLGNVGGIALEANTIYGSYSHDFPNAPNASYVALDTRTGIHHNFTSIAELDGYAGHPVTLVDPQDFQASYPAYRRLNRIENLIRFAPPLIVLVIFPIYLFRVRHRTTPDHATR
jgi:hypothetical protein